MKASKKPTQFRYSIEDLTEDEYKHILNGLNTMKHHFIEKRFDVTDVVKTIERMEDKLGEIFP